MVRVAPPLLEPPDPAPILGQTRTTSPGAPEQKSDNVAVVSNDPPVSNSTVPKLLALIVAVQDCADAAVPAVASAITAKMTIDRAACALANKLARICYAVLKQHEPYAGLTRREENKKLTHTAYAVAS